jgi:hypothetical protein
LPTLAERTQAQKVAPFETFLFHTMKVVELALNKNLSDERIVEEVRKIRRLSKAILADIHKENAAKHKEEARLSEQA